MSEQVLWIDADGTQTSLHGGTILSLIDRIGDTVPPYETLMEEVPGEAGGRVRVVKVKMREIQMPVVVRESSRAALVATLRTLAYALNPYRGEGILRITAADGTSKELRCRCVSGLDVKDHGFSYREMTLRFRSSAPYWLGSVKQQTLTPTGTAAEGSGFPVTFPAYLARAMTFGTLTLSNAGDVECYPQWTITGPANGITLRNKTTRAILSIQRAIGAGETVVIKTMPGERTARTGTGVSLIGLWSGTFWGLQRGTNIISFETGGAADGSLLHVSYREQWLSL